MLKTICIIVAAYEALAMMDRYGADVTTKSTPMLIDFFDGFLQKALFEEPIGEETLLHKLMALGASYYDAQELLIMLHDSFTCNIHRTISRYNSEGKYSVSCFVIHDLGKIEIQLKEIRIKEASLVDLLRLDLLEGMERGDYFNERYRALLGG